MIRDISEVGVWWRSVIQMVVIIFVETQGHSPWLAVLHAGEKVFFFNNNNLRLW